MSQIPSPPVLDQGKFPVGPRLELLTDRDIEDFRRIYQAEFQENLDFERAKVIAENFVEAMALFT